VRADVQAADLNLSIRTTERRLLELKEADVEKAASEAAASRSRSQKEMTDLQGDLATRVSALYRMGRLGYLRALVGTDSGRRLLSGLEMMSFLARRDAALLSRYESAVLEFTTKTQDLSRRQKELAALAKESRQKEAEVASARSEKAALLARLSRTEHEERNVVATLEDKSSRLSALLDLLETRGRSLPAGAASIRKFRGVLDWPAKGKVAVPFGRIANPKFPKTFLRSNGWTIDVPDGAEVHAVFAGDVAYAQWLKGYGNLVVLDHGDGIFTLYGRLATGTVQRGERVGVGDRVGRLGSSPEDEVPGLYFEIRDARSSVDPQGWLK
jgi:septal ring factor EnvC (AmiA/AmiB activator)